MRTRTMRSPIFGPCRLVPHGMDEAPEATMAAGYVELEGDPNNLLLAINRKGDWLDRRLKPFARPVVAWFHVEKADGTRLF